MRTFKNFCAQGDVYFQRIAELPEGAVPTEKENGKVVVAHSETGHHHSFDGDTVTMYNLPDSIMECLLVVDQPTPLIHERSHDTHEPIMFEPGIYKGYRQREYTPEGFRRVED